MGRSDYPMEGADSDQLPDKKHLMLADLQLFNMDNKDRYLLTSSDLNTSMEPYQ